MCILAEAFCFRAGLGLASNYSSACCLTINWDLLQRIFNWAERVRSPLFHIQMPVSAVGYLIFVKFTLHSRRMRHHFVATYTPIRLHYFTASPAIHHCVSVSIWTELKPLFAVSFNDKLLETKVRRIYLLRFVRYAGWPAKSKPLSRIIIKSY